MLYCVFTVDGDWKEYFNAGLADEERFSRHETLLHDVREEISIAQEFFNGKFIHFIHTSPLVRDEFLTPCFLPLWKEIIQNGGDVGLHCHEDIPQQEYYSRDTNRMREVITQQVARLREAGLSVCAYRGGYMAFQEGLIPVLEENLIEFDFSCEPGRYLVEDNIVIADWRGAPLSLYRMSRGDHRREGDSNLWEVPVGAAGGRHLYFEKADAGELAQIAEALRRQSHKTGKDIVVSALTHSWNFSTAEQQAIVKEKISALKRFATFVAIAELHRLKS